LIDVVMLREDVVLIDVVMLREMAGGLSHVKKRVFFFCSVIKLYCICWIENKWTVDSFVLKKNDRNIFSIFV
jgi:isoprenylcysteine carboxyl methyltransferase (ICMT) family protein YpbQ